MKTGKRNPQNKCYIGLCYDKHFAMDIKCKFAKKTKNNVFCKYKPIHRDDILYCMTTKEYQDMWKL